MITGQALYELLLSADPDLAYTWQDLNTRDRYTYEEVATALNGQYLAPLQKQSGSALTGEGVASTLNLKWERCCSSAQVLYEEIATKLNAQYISPLQGLVRDLEQTLVYCSCWGNEFPVEKVEKLQERVRQLLKDEQKG